MLLQYSYKKIYKLNTSKVTNNNEKRAYNIVVSDGIKKF